MKRTIYKNKNYIYFIIQNIRPVYYKAKVNNTRVNKKVRISKDKFYKEIARSKKIGK